MLIPYIYKIPKNSDKEGRKMVVIDGQPYYQSTGRNSSVPDIWFPFVMIRGHYSFNKIKSATFSRHLSKKVNKKHSSTYIIKTLRNYLRKDIETLPNDPHDKITAKRNPLKNTLITAARLTGPTFPEKTLIQSGLTPEELKLARDPLVLEYKPQFASKNPDLINDWLIIQGADVVTKLFANRTIHTTPDEEVIDIDTMEEKKLAPTNSSESSMRKTRKGPY